LLEHYGTSTGKTRSLGFARDDVEKLGKPGEIGISPYIT
jgi:hypothetical protein